MWLIRVRQSAHQTDFILINISNFLAKHVCAKSTVSTRKHAQASSLSNKHLSQFGYILYLILNIGGLPEQGETADEVK